MPEGFSPPPAHGKVARGYRAPRHHEMEADRGTCLPWGCPARRAPVAGEVRCAGSRLPALPSRWADLRPAPSRARAASRQTSACCADFAAPGTRRAPEAQGARPSASRPAQKGPSHLFPIRSRRKMVGTRATTELAAAEFIVDEDPITAEEVIAAKKPVAAKKPAVTVRLTPKKKPLAPKTADQRPGSNAKSRTMSEATKEVDKKQLKILSLRKKMQEYKQIITSLKVESVTLTADLNKKKARKAKKNKARREKKKGAKDAAAQAFHGPRNPTPDGLVIL
ncbi:hypothetical protein CALVIDRAFT_569193 [Calocera viscosa TUFC12733]|uniref:Uncharacterized protein n=1 Tax=Calocera viscosa (strain TUFC12733) TaxID=1330018 RepID=A0A167G9V3_CALVF|nr:hypothetical protein CALVIDRAFT_569193 [Calocera viscosa TUFC12733]